MLAAALKQLADRQVADSKRSEERADNLEQQLHYALHDEENDADEEYEEGEEQERVVDQVEGVEETPHWGRLSWRGPVDTTQIQKPKPTRDASRGRSAPSKGGSNTKPKPSNIASPSRTESAGGSTTSSNESVQDPGKPRYQVPVAVITTTAAVRKVGTKIHVDHNKGVTLGMKMKFESTYHSESFFVKRSGSIYATAPFRHEYPRGSRITEVVSTAIATASRRGQHDSTQPTITDRKDGRVILRDSSSDVSVCLDGSGSIARKMNIGKVPNSLSAYNDWFFDIIAQATSADPQNKERIYQSRHKFWKLRRDSEQMYHVPTDIAKLESVLLATGTRGGLLGQCSTITAHTE